MGIWRRDDGMDVISIPLILKVKMVPSTRSSMGRAASNAIFVARETNIGPSDFGVVLRERAVNKAAL